jgi:TatD DNase family protein
MRRTVIDTHAHVHSKAFNKDREDVLERVWASGVRYLVEVNITARGWPLVIEMAAGDPRIFATVGIHPHDTGQAEPDDRDRLFEEVSGPKVCAIGETGLDYYRNYAPHEIQRRFFRRHVALARESGLPLVVHARAAHEDVLSILEEEGCGEVHGVLHCFSGDLAIAERAREMNFYLGFGGAITYNPRKSAPLLRSIGLDRIVLETDCPYLTPHPHRNERNDPSYVPKIAAAIAEYLGIDVAEVESVTDANAIQLFELPG